MTYLTQTNTKTNISFQKTTVTTHQDVTTSWAAVNGGQITYTPSSSTAKVILEFTTAYGRLDPDNSVIFRLQIGNDVSSLGDVVTNNVDYHNGFGATTTTNNMNHSDIITLKYHLDGWTGSKVLQIQCQAYDSNGSLEGIVNGNRPTSTTPILPFNPFIMVYEA